MLPNSPIVVACRQFFQTRNFRETGVLAAVSGGADSVALLLGLLAIREESSLRVCVGHYDHGWRANSIEDARWVEAFCAQRKVPFQSGSGKAAASGLDGPSRERSEERARDLRYAFLEQAAAECRCPLIAVGHTRDDQVETVLHHILRGSGLKGVAGIPATRPLGGAATLIRPLLSAKRQDAVDALAAVGQEFRVDPANDSPRYTRNRIRSELLPLLRERFNPRLDEALLRLASQAADSHSAIERLADEQWKSSQLETQPEGVRLRRQPLADQPIAVIRELLLRVWQERGWPRQALGFAHLERLAEQVQTGAPPQLSLPENVLAICRGSVLEMRRPAPERPPV